jgi:hypothetical protein
MYLTSSKHKEKHAISSVFYSLSKFFSKIYVQIEAKMWNKSARFLVPREGDGDMRWMTIRHRNYRNNVPLCTVNLHDQLHNLGTNPLLTHQKFAEKRLDDGENWLVSRALIVS